MEILPLVIGAVFSLVGVLIFLQGFKRMKDYSMVKDTPTAKVRSAAAGLVELSGKPSAAREVEAPISKTNCLYVLCVTSELRQRNKGKEWVKINNEVRQDGITLSDETGTIPIAIEEAEVRIPVTKTYIDQKEGLITALMDAVRKKERQELEEVRAGDTSENYPVGSKRYDEYIITKNDSLYVIGTLDRQTGEARIIKGKNEACFIVSTQSEKEMLGKLRNDMWIAWGAGALCIIIGVGVTIWVLQ